MVNGERSRFFFESPSNLRVAPKEEYEPQGVNESNMEVLLCKGCLPTKEPTDSTEICDGQRVDLSGISAVAEKCKVLLWWCLLLGEHIMYILFVYIDIYILYSIYIYTYTCTSTHSI